MRPYTRRPPADVPVGLLRRDGRVILEAGELVDLDETPAGAAIFADRRDGLGLAMGGRGSVLRWNDSVYRFEADGVKVHLLSEVPDLPEAMAGLVAWRDWLTSHGARVGSPRQASRSLLRATLEAPIYLDAQAPPIRDVIGGRQQLFSPPGHYPQVEIWDMQAAYARQTADLTYGGRWFEIPGEITPDDETTPIIGHARVRIPDVAVGVLPRRNQRASEPGLRWLSEREYPTRRTISGLWAYGELYAARRQGADVKIDRSYVAPSNGWRPFLPWWRAIFTGRALAGYASTLAKITGNVLWGSFIAEGIRTRLAFTGGQRREVVDPVPGRPPQARALAETITAGVRVRLWAELVEPHRRQVISAHTDGGLLREGANVWAKLPDRGGWRQKLICDSVIVLGPQAFAWRRGDDFGYVVAGVPSEDAPGIFANLCDVVIGHRKKRPDPQTIEGYRAIVEAFPGAMIE